MKSFAKFFVVLVALLPVTVLAQSVADNLRPVGQVCLAGQNCVGTTVGDSGSAAVAAPAATSEPVASPSAVASPAPAAAEPAGFDAAATYQASCFACHGTGAAGAPQPGNAEAWGPRIERGLDTVMANVMNGLNAMPPKGLCMNCSESDLRAVVEYMLAQ